MGIIANFTRLSNNWNKVDLIAIVGDIAEEKEAQVTELQSKQLLAGKDNEGHYLPRYVDDPYFKSREAALRYMNWKIGKSPNKEKPNDVMDFWITGYTHSTLFSKRQGNSILFGSNGKFNNSIMLKTDGKYLGLNKESLQEGWRLIFRDAAIVKINQIIHSK